MLEVGDRGLLEGFAESIDLVFLTGAGVMVLAFVVTFFIKEIPLRAGTGEDPESLPHV